VNKGVVNGVTAADGGSVFEPEANVTREQFAKMLVAALGIYDESAVCDFADVSTDDWYYTSVASAINAGIITGYGDGTFGAGRNITREEMAAMVSRANLEFIPVVRSVKFTDDEGISSWSKDAVSLMQQANIINGFEDNSFKPQENATRAQSAKIIFSVLGV
jgi:hypothetical protein